MNKFKPRNTYSSIDVFINELENMLKDLLLQFNEDLINLSFSHEHLFIFCKTILETTYNPFLERIFTNKPQGMNFAQIMKVLNIIHKVSEKLMNEIADKLEPTEPEEKELYGLLGSGLGKCITSFKSIISEFIESNARIYLDQVLSSSMIRLQAKINFREAADQAQNNENLKNIDMNSIRQDIEDLSVDDKEEKALLNKIGESFSFTKGDLSIDHSRLIKDVKNVSKDSQSQQNNRNVIPFQELTRYHIKDAISVTDKIKTPDYLQPLIDLNLPEVSKGPNGLGSFENLVPSRISQFLFKYLQSFDPYLEILIKYQKLVRGHYSFLNQVHQTLLKDATNVQERVIF